MIDIFFILLNFSIFVFIVIYYFRKKLAPDILKKLSARKVFFKDLDSKKENSEKEIKKFNSQKKFQEKFYESLDKKVDLWKSKISEEKNKKIEEKVVIENKIEKQALIKAKFIKEKKFIKKTLKKTFASSYSDLKIFFDNPSTCSSFNEKLADKILLGF